MAAATEDSWPILTKIRAVLGGTVVDSVAEMYKLMPDSVLFGSLLLYFLTQNLSYGVFAVFVIELTLSHRLIAWIFSKSAGSSPDTNGQTKPTKPISCRAGYKTPRWDAERMFDHDPYPSYGIFSVVSMATYIGCSMNEFTDVLQAMGQSWKSRNMVAYTFMALVIITFILARVFMSNCDDSLGEIIIASCFAVVVGYIFFSINSNMFGKESVNFLGLPFLKEKETDIYVCASTA
jgi:hypothetical protein